MEQEKGNLSQCHMARELCVAPLAPILTERAPTSQDSGTERGWRAKKADHHKERAALIHLA